MKKYFASYIWLLAIGMLAILLTKCDCNNASIEKLPKPTNAPKPPNPPTPPAPDGVSMVKRAKEKGGSDFLVKKLQEIEDKVVGMDMNERQVGTQNTALHEAVLLGDIVLIKYLLAHLLAHRADLEAKNVNNETAADIAIKQGFGQTFFEEVFKGLEKLVGDPPTSDSAIDPTTGSAEVYPSHYPGMAFINGRWQYMVRPGITLARELELLEADKKQQDEAIRRALEESTQQLEEQTKRTQELIKEKQEHDLKFKNGKIFNSHVRNSNVEEVRMFLEFIKEEVEPIGTTTRLDEQRKQHISNLFNDINRQLKAIQAELGGIEKCLNMTEKSPRINYEKEAKDLVIAKELIKELERCQEELCTLLAARRKELNNPELEAACKEVEQRKGSK